MNKRHQQIFFILILLWIIPLRNSAQISYNYLDINNVKGLISSDGSNFIHNKLMTPGFEAPKNSNKHTIFGSCLWVGGFDPSNEIRTAAMTYKISGAADFWPGPIDTMGKQAADTSDWNKVWKVNRSVIDDHRRNYNKSGYVIPNEILKWPANGTGPYSRVLAPFVDLNRNEIYEPALGEFPFIPGDQAIYFIYNDLYDTHSQTKSSSLGIEVHGMAYGYDTTGAIGNSIFVQYRIKNRSQTDFSQFNIGVWTDFDIGNPFDDYAGCDSMLEMYYAYNGDNTDDGITGYGQNPPAQAVVFLNKELTNFISYNDNISTNGVPEVRTDYHNYMNAIWKNYQHLRYGGDGFNNIWEDKPTNLMYPSKYDVAVPGWSEVTTNNSPGNRTTIGSCSPVNFYSGDYISFDVAYVFTEGGNGNNLTSVDDLFSDVQTVRDFYNDNISGIENPAGNFRVKYAHIIPNPMASDAVVRFDNAKGDLFRMKIFDVSGKAVYEKPGIHDSEVKINNNKLSKGIYLVVLYSHSSIFKAKLIVQ